MDLESLFAQLQSTQSAASAVRLSDRNVIELVNKLKQLGILGDDLLHTISGKEYITTARLKQDINTALAQAGGRLSLVELPALLGVDLVHCEAQAAALVAEARQAHVLQGGGQASLVQAQGELMTSQYFDAVAAEINDLLQETGQLSLADLAMQYSLTSELLMSVVTARMESVIQV
ncbi:E3 UFM1-protein ligase 1 [Haematococcus lacustris]